MSASPMVPNQMHGKEDGEEKQAVEEDEPDLLIRDKVKGGGGAEPRERLGPKAPETLAASPAAPGGPASQDEMLGL